MRGWGRGRGWVGGGGLEGVGAEADGEEKVQGPDHHDTVATSLTAGGDRTVPVETRRRSLDPRTPQEVPAGQVPSKLPRNPG